MTARVDYDTIAHLYDERSRDHEVDAGLLAFLAARGANDGDGTVIVDVGCGTGKQMAANRAPLPKARLIGIDRSHAMLRIGRGRCPSARWLQADGPFLPLASASVDYATNQFSYPHIGRTGALLAELLRVLKPGGRFVMTNIDPWSMGGWLIYRFFPAARQRDYQDYLPIERFVALMTTAGFENVHARRREFTREEPLAGFLAFVSERHRASQLMVISDAAYAAGIQRIRDLIRGDTRGDAVMTSEIGLVTITGDKPA